MLTQNQYKKLILLTIYFKNETQQSFSLLNKQKKPFYLKLNCESIIDLF